MILIKDNFLPEEVFESLHEYAKKSIYKEIEAGDKSFLTIPTPKNVLQYFDLEAHELHFSFIRKAHKNFDTDLRIHADNIIGGKKTIFASVLYLNKDNEEITPNGTAFYNHKIHGYKLSEKNIDLFDDIILKDSNDKSKWVQTDFISSKENRFLLYNADYFHSKFPSVIEKGERIVLVNFYTLR